MFIEICSKQDELNFCDLLDLRRGDEPVLVRVRLREEGPGEEPEELLVDAEPWRLI